MAWASVRRSLVAVVLLASCSAPTAAGPPVRPANEPSSPEDSPPVARDVDSDDEAGEPAPAPPTPSVSGERSESAPASLPDPPEGTPLHHGPAPATTAPEDVWVDHGQDALEHDGVRISVDVHATPREHTDEDGETWTLETYELRVRIAPTSATEGSVLHLEDPLGDLDCDAFVPEPLLLGTTADGRVLVDARLECDFGEDFSSTTIEHRVLLLDPDARRGWLLHSGASTGTNELGVCETWSVLSLSLEGDALVVHRFEGVARNRDNARELPPASRPKCRPRAETKTEEARLRLPGPAITLPKGGPVGP